MHAPPGFGERPPITGWYAEFEDLSLPPGSVGYAKDATRFLGATFDPSGLYRFSPCAECSPRTASPRAQHLGPRRAAPAAVARAHRRNAAGRGRAAQPTRRQARTPASSPSEARTRSAGTRELKASNCITDVRGDVLRIGFGIYQDEDDVERLVELLGELDVTDDARSRRARRWSSRCCSSPTSSISSTGRSSASSPGRSCTTCTLPTPQFGALGGLAFAILYSVLGIPLAFLADRTSRSR